LAFGETLSFRLGGEQTEGVWEQYRAVCLDLTDSKQCKGEKHCIPRGFIICNLHQMGLLLWCLHQR
jgi:hypothetical protein